MADKILEFSQKNHNEFEIKRFQDEIISLNNSRYLFLFAKYIKGSDISLITEKLLELNDIRYLRFYLR